MSGHQSESHDQLDATMEHPGPEQLQAMVDATEDAAGARYRRLNDYSCLLQDALRHADAMTRLELALQYAQVL
jgi:hypothetical protein